MVLDWSGASPSSRSRSANRRSSATTSCAARDFFDADSFPAITFRSDSVELGADGAATVSGTLTIRGVSRPVTARGTYSPPRADPFGTVRAGLELRAAIDRRSWEMTWQMALPDGGDALGWDVEITAQLEFVRVD
jgi:polyisoprenoid-binding protein YceI